MSDDHIEATIADAQEFAKVLVAARLSDAPGEVGERVERLFASVRSEILRDLPDATEALRSALDERLLRVVAIIGGISDALVMVIRAAQRAGICVHTDLLASAYEAALDLEEAQ